MLAYNSWSCLITHYLYGIYKSYEPYDMTFPEDVGHFFELSFEILNYLSLAFETIRFAGSNIMNARINNNPLNKMSLDIN